MLHPESARAEPSTITLSEEGITVIKCGGKHRVITDIDYDHFKQFLHQGLCI